MQQINLGVFIILKFERTKKWKKKKKRVKREKEKKEGEEGKIRGPKPSPGYKLGF